MVGHRFTDLLSNAGELHRIIGPHVAEAATLSHVMDKAPRLAHDWKHLDTPRRRAILMCALERIVVHGEQINIVLKPRGLLAALSSWPRPPKGTPIDDGSDSITIPVPASLRRSGRSKRMVIAGQSDAESDAALIKLVLKAFALRNALLAGDESTLERIAAREGINSSYATRLLRLSFLSPELIRMILDGRQPPTLHRPPLAGGHTAAHRLG